MLSEIDCVFKRLFTKEILKKIQINFFFASGVIYFKLFHESKPYYIVNYLKRNEIVLVSQKRKTLNAVKLITVGKNSTKWKMEKIFVYNTINVLSKKSILQMSATDLQQMFSIVFKKPHPLILRHLQSMRKLVLREETDKV